LLKLFRKRLLVCSFRISKGPITRAVLLFLLGASLTLGPDIAGMVAAMTEGDPGVESERASHNIPG